MIMDTFEKLLVGLKKSKVEFILVGGLAVDLCGFTRATIDVDILIDHDPENVERLLLCLNNFGEGSAKELKVSDFDIEEGCIRIVEYFPLDVFTIMGGNMYHDLLKFSNKYEIEKGIDIKYLNKDGLILLKEKSIRPKDQIDVQELIQLKNNQ